MDEMFDWCMQATRKEGLINSGLGKLPPKWGEKERWARQRIHELKRAVQAEGDCRHKVTALEDIGFDFEQGKKDDKSPIGDRPSGPTISNSWLKYLAG